MPPTPLPPPTSTWPVRAYLGHLLIPAALLADVLDAWRRGEIELGHRDGDTTIAVLMTVWLIGGLAVLAVSRDRQALARRVAKPVLALYALFGVLLLVEVCGRMFLPLPAQIPGVQAPGTRRVSTIDPAAFPGVQGQKIFTLNALGLRGPMPPTRGGSYRVVAVGGSTTICVILDDSEAWPEALMREMNANRTGTARPPVWIGNAGVNGANTVDHLALLQWLPGIVPADMLVFLVGVNDMQATLAFEGAPTEAFLAKTAGLRKELAPGTLWRSWYPRYRRTFIFKLVREAARRFAHNSSQSGADRRYDVVELRARRAVTPTVPMPDLRIGLDEYRSRLVALADRCRVLQTRCLLLTQPSMWRADLSPAEQRLIWLGYVGRFEKPRGYASIGDLGVAMDAYNRTMLDVCRTQHLECLDVASDFPKDTSVFNDDVHFNEAGSRRLADTLKQYLESRPPFSAR